MSYIDNMFFVPYIFLDIVDWNQKKKKLLDILNGSTLQKSELEEVKSDYVKSESYDDKIQDVLQEEIKITIQNLGLHGFGISNSWFEVSEKGMYHQVHNHGPIGFSAVCFVEYDEEEHIPTQFISPFANFINGSILDFSPSGVKEGTLLFFPSSIHHYTVPNKSEKTRTTLSFNLKPCK